ncbi:2-hydroxyacid dehydrogenase [Alloalcanivorax profundimaris]|uniref:2-hydroxyacid dehydrogenase n=1 Tax=Alloalcanivorax profundimaris TaxID=2735259 RepID=UPI000C3DA337|nr:2-hydroxyacid dehydrogenase [Alloalcanivorax profundimaris]MAO59054.1 hydroxyacid dehydrogenase [Alcanivorax sp.]MAY10953.1 hydroxyacid dehydrogenase [Alcanivorax sp.]MBF1801604.1 2-hydroxyacid dehydrogenase [Alloalcanivorax profundimaris]MBI56235.1 hydroxyacid dehydrogenase [Alcanivorax sp.]MBU58923.1 hydroxyacid dehydrogenase [Alcanivorax sp.]
MTTLNIRTLTLPTQWHLDTVKDQAGDLKLGVWDLTGAPEGLSEAEVEAVVFHHPAGEAGKQRLATLPNLKLIQTQSTGYDGFIEAGRGAAVASAYGLHAGPTAELTLGLILTAQRGLDHFARDQAEHVWRPFTTPGLLDRKVLMIGTGGVGAAIAERLAPFGVELTRVGTRARDDERGHVHGVDELPALLPAAEIVILITPLNDATRGMVNADFLARLPDGALVVNVARGPVVDTDALLAELRSGRLRAALDVVDPEPLPADHPLWDAPGLCLVPHVGGRSEALKPRLATYLREQVRRIANGEPLQNLVHPGNRG